VRVLDGVRGAGFVKCGVAESLVGGGKTGSRFRCERSTHAVRLHARGTRGIGLDLMYGLPALYLLVVSAGCGTWVATRVAVFNWSPVCR
jgi:hypothetical protein